MTIELYIYQSGHKVWRKNEKYHKLSGPAIEFTSGDKCWFINHVEYTYLEYLIEVEQLNANK